MSTWTECGWQKNKWGSRNSTALWFFLILSLVVFYQIFTDRIFVKLLWKLNLWKEVIYSLIKSGQIFMKTWLPVAHIEGSWRRSPMKIRSFEQLRNLLLVQVFEMYFGRICFILLSMRMSLLQNWYRSIIVI